MISSFVQMEFPLDFGLDLAITPPLSPGRGPRTISTPELRWIGLEPERPFSPSDLPLPMLGPVYMDRASSPIQFGCDAETQTDSAVVTPLTQPKQTNNTVRNVANIATSMVNNLAGFTIDTGIGGSSARVDQIPISPDPVNLSESRPAPTDRESRPRATRRLFETSPPHDRRPRTQGHHRSRMIPEGYGINEHTIHIIGPNHHHRSVDGRGQQEIRRSRVRVAPPAPGLVPVHTLGPISDNRYMPQAYGYHAQAGDMGVTPPFSGFPPTRTSVQRAIHGHDLYGPDYVTYPNVPSHPSMPNGVSYTGPHHNGYGNMNAQISQQPGHQVAPPYLVAPPSRPPMDLNHRHLVAPPVPVAGLGLPAATWRPWVGADGRIRLPNQYSPISPPSDYATGTQFNF